MKKPDAPANKHGRVEGRKGHLIGLIASRLGGHFIVEAKAGALEDQIVVRRLFLTEVLAFLRQDPDANLQLLVDLTAVERRDGQLEVVYRLRSPRLGYRLRASVLLPPDELLVPSIVPLYRAAEWLERELWEMFGVYPDGHPFLRPLLLYPEFTSPPLRKSFPLQQEHPLVSSKTPVIEPDRAPLQSDETGGDDTDGEG